MSYKACHVSAMSVDKMAGSPSLAGQMGREKQDYPQWVQVHPSQKVATVGSAPSKCGEPGWHCNCSLKWHKSV